MIIQVFKYALLLILNCSFFVSLGNTNPSNFDWKQLPEFPAFGNQTKANGVTGAFSGVHNDVLIVAGGANFDEPKWETNKSWHNDIFVLEKDAKHWSKKGELPFQISYGNSLSIDEGVVCMGGANNEKIMDDVFLLQWDKSEKRIIFRKLGKLPCTCAYGAATLLDGYIYMAGGQGGPDLSSALKNFWRINVKDLLEEKTNWEILPAWNGPARAFNLLVSQSNGENGCLFLFSGRSEQKGKVQFLNDTYTFNPVIYESGRKQMAWHKKADLPACVMAGSAVSLGQNHIFVLSGADGSMFYEANNLRDNHPGFPKKSYGYNTITDTWFEAATIPANHLTTNIFKWENKIVVPSGEIRPRMSSPKVWILSPVQTSKTFGWANTTSLIIYLILMIGVGVFFSFRNKNTDDFFRGGQRIPWWAAGLSIFATMLSSLTFIAIPAKAYATDWVQSIVNLGIVLVAPFVVYFALPFFRKIDVTSVYEYLERRFNILVRLMASSLFVFFQIGRMAIVMYLPSLALATITSLSVETCILIIGVLSILYCTLGGLEAVIWTDAIQALILLGGAFLSFVIIILNIDGGLSGFFEVASSHQKFHVVNWDWDVLSITRSAFWVVFIGGIAQAVIPGVSDQAVIQRYMSVDSESKARKAIWTNAVITIPATLLFFALGTALFVFYKTHPNNLDPNFQIDAVFPLFIANELPIGIAGLVVAGIFAAAQSTISTSMNSMSTSIVTDFANRFNWLNTEKGYLNLARILTLTLGLIGTSIALIMANANIISLWDTFMKVIGLFGGPLCGVFLLGMLSRRSNTTGVIIGLIFGVATVAFVQTNTNVSYLLHAGVGIATCMISGFIFSLIPIKN